jgi:hypothetical protein
MRSRKARSFQRATTATTRPSKKRAFVRKGVWVWIRLLKKHEALVTTNPTQWRTHFCTRPGCWRLINMGYDNWQKCWQTGKGLAPLPEHPARRPREDRDLARPADAHFGQKTRPTGLRRVAQGAVCCLRHDGQQDERVRGRD